jgi:hypothetical protein
MRSLSLLSALVALMLAISDVSAQTNTKFDCNSAVTNCPNGATCRYGTGTRTCYTNGTGKCGLCVAGTLTSCPLKASCPGQTNHFIPRSCSCDCNVVVSNGC